MARSLYNTTDLDMPREQYDRQCSTYAGGLRCPGNTAAQLFLYTAALINDGLAYLGPLVAMP